MRHQHTRRMLETWKLIFTVLKHIKLESVSKPAGVGGGGVSSVSSLPVLLTAVLRHTPVGCPDWC